MKSSVQELLYNVGDTLGKIMEGVAEATRRFQDYQIPDELSKALAVDFCQCSLGM